MKIVLIGQSFNKNFGQGIYKYSGCLYENLRKVNKDTKKIEVGYSKNSYKMILNNTIGSIIKTSTLKADIYHFLMPEISLPCLFKRPSIVTVHDLIPLLIKERRESFIRYFKFMLKVAKKADHLIAVSKTTKNNLIEILKIPEEKISVIYEGVDHEKFYPLRRKERREKFIIGYLGGLGKRKNVEILLEVAKKLKNENVIFKIAGKGPEKEKLEKKARRLKLNNVKFVGFIPEEMLNEFYNSLNLFIFPSLYEGFGLPVLEAMACGVPVIVSKTSSLLEIVGEAGILVNPENINEIVKAIENILNDKNFQLKLKRKSLKQAKKFSWEKTAKETLKVYEELKW